MRNEGMRLLAIAFCLAALEAWAQQKKGVPPLKPASEWKSLDTTMKFISESLNAVGPVSYASHGHDSNNGHSWTNHYTNQASGVFPNASACRINYHWKTVQDGKVLMDAKVGFLLKDVQKVDVLTRQQYFNEQNLEGGHPSWSAKVEPVVFLVRVQRPAHVENHFVLLDETLANRVAKAITQAAALCNDNKSDPTTKK